MDEIKERPGPSHEELLQRKEIGNRIRIAQMGLLLFVGSDTRMDLINVSWADGEYEECVRLAKELADEHALAAPFVSLVQASAREMEKYSEG